MKSLLNITAFCLVIITVSCDSRTYEEISGPVNIPQTVKFSQDVKPIIDQNCVVCHSPGGASSFFPLTDYGLVKSAVDEILDRIQRPKGDPLKMPQGGSLSQTNIEIIRKWKADGLQP